MTITERSEMLEYFMTHYGKMDFCMQYGHYRWKVASQKISELSCGLHI